MKHFTAYLFITFGILCFLYASYLYWERTNPQRIVFYGYHANPLKKNTRNNSIPVAIIIPSQKITLPVSPAAVKNGNWTTTTNGISYLLSSPVPGDKGNSILYGHNWTNLLGKLVYVKPGEQLIVLFADHTKKSFTVMYTATVTPDQTHILDQTKDKRVTLYTCTGFLDTKRFVAVAK